MTGLVVVLFRKVRVVHLLTVFIHAPVLAIEVDNATLVGPLIELQIGEVTQGVHVRIPNVGSRLEGIVVVGRSLENQTLVFISFLHMEKLSLKGMVVPHLISDDAIKPALTVGIAVISVFIAVP